MDNTTLPPWFHDHPPVYDITKTYLENVEHGPFFSGKIPKRVFPPKEQWTDFLGFKVATPIGVPAGPLLTSKWIKLAADLGYDIPIYKTIRSQEHEAHPLPNMIYVDTHGPILPHQHKESALHVKTPSDDIESLAVTNSFGMPSRSPEFLMRDIALANQSLKEGQVMVVSIVGTKRNNESFCDDFVRCAKFAKDAGGRIIEANFSCPNVEKHEGSLYLSPDTVLEYTKALTKALGPTPLILKMGIFSTIDQMRDVLIAAARGGARAVAGINTISMKVVEKTGEPALGKDRLTSGICGGPIREAALNFLRHAFEINRKEKLDLTLIGTGGITLPEHFDLFFDAGADVAMTATGMIWDPYLAMRYHQKAG